MSAPAYPLNSVDRALNLITLLGERESLRVHDVAKELGVAASTAHRLLAMLVHHGFAIKDRQHAYWPGPALKLVHRTKDRTSELARVAQASLRDLSAETGETSHLMVLEGTGTRFIASAQGRQARGVTARVGRILPAHLTSGGKALLATLTHDELAELYPRGLRLTSAAAGPDIPALLNELSVTRRRGFGINLEETEQRINCVGAAILDAEGRGIAAVAVAAPSARAPYRQLIRWSEPVLQTAREITQSLSSHAAPPAHGLPTSVGR